MAVVFWVVRQKYADRPLTIMSPWLNGGRWNVHGTGILYTAEHPALALIEILVHMPQVPYSELTAYRLFRLEIPDTSQRVLTSTKLLTYWRENTYGQTQPILIDWLTQPDVLAIGVPSSVMPDEIIYLLHPAHADYQRIRVIEEKELVIDSRLWPA